MSAIATKRIGRATLAVLAATVCAAALAPAAGAANLSLPIRAVFLKEFSRTAYTMDRGQLLTFKNDDPFLVHAIGGSLLASPADPGKIRLVRNSPYLEPGVYPFGDPLHPEMNGTLTVSSTGTSPPPDTTPPGLKAKVIAVRAGSGKVRVRVTPSEAADIDVKLFAGKKKIASNSAAAVDPVARVVALQASPAGRARMAPGTEITVRVRVTDVTGKAAAKRITASVGGKKKK